MRKLKATLAEIEPNWFQQHEFDAGRENGPGASPPHQMKQD